MKRFFDILKSIWRWVRTDGMLHICLCALLFVALGWIRPLWIPALIVLSVGLGKELFYDCLAGKGTASWHDIFCDIIGIAVGFVLVVILKG